MKKCLVCDNQIPSSAQSCPHCGFSAVLPAFLSRAHFAAWKQQNVEPKRQKYLLEHTLAELQSSQEELRRELARVRQENAELQSSQEELRRELTQVRQTEAQLQKSAAHLTRRVNQLEQGGSDTTRNWSKTPPETESAKADRTGRQEKKNVQSTRTFEIKDNVLLKYTGQGGDVVIPDGVTRIEASAFKGCKGLTGVALPESVTRIGNWAFSSCFNLKSITFPNHLTSIGNWAFGYCSSLQSIALPESVVSIGIGAFTGCSHLKNVIIRSDRANIGEGAFCACGMLNSITLKNGVAEIQRDCFKDVTAVVYYPESCKNASWVGKNYGGKLAWRLLTWKG